MYRSDLDVLFERAEGARVAIAEIDRERAARARELAALESKLGTSRDGGLWLRVRPVAFTLALSIAAAAALLQTARLELVSNSTSTAVQLYVGHDAPRLHASYE